jgi:hypothetical protein
VFPTISATAANDPLSPLAIVPPIVLVLELVLVLDAFCSLHAEASSHFGNPRSRIPTGRNSIRTEYEDEFEYD